MALRLEVDQSIVDNIKATVDELILEYEGPGDKKPVEIVINTDCATAFCIIAQLQLAGRHPANIGESRKAGEQFARTLQEAVVKIHPEWAGLIEKGWNPEFDKP